MLDPNMFQGGAPTPPGAGPTGPAGAGAPAPGGGGGPSPTSPEAGDKTDRLRAAIEELTAYKLEEQDDEDLAMVAKIVADIQKLLATNQKLADQAVGAGPGAKFMRKQGGGGSY